MYVHIIELLDLKLRPIVAGPNCLTRSLNTFDILLKPFFYSLKVASKITLTSYQKVQEKTVDYLCSVV